MLDTLRASCPMRQGRTELGGSALAHKEVICESA